MKHLHESPGLITRLGKVPLMLLALGASGLVAGCSSEPGNHSDVDQIGSLGVNLTVAPGITLNSVTYSITGNGFTKTGTIDTTGAATVSGTIGGIPAGKGFTIVLTATSVEGNTTFTGSAKFDVTAGGKTSVTIYLNGTGKSGNGTVLVNGTVNLDPIIDEVTVTPLTVFVGSSVTLSTVAHDPDQGPSPLTYYWSTTGGVIDNPLATSAKLTSTTPGTFTINLTVSDGAGTSSSSATVTFVRPAAVGTADGGTVVADGGVGPKNPNILLVIADDYGAEASALFPNLAGDHGQVSIPTVEGLAKNGLVFDNAWASPVCSPTRSTIVTGQYGFRTGVTTVGDVLPPTTPTVFEGLTAGSSEYEQAFFGKYHLGGGTIDPPPGVAYPGVPAILQHVRDLGITNYRGILGGALVDYFNWVTYDINGPALANTTYSTTALTNFAIDYIHQHEANKPNEPWFLYQAFNAPHAANGGNNPYQVPPANLHHVDLSSIGNPAPGTYLTSIPVYQADIQALDTELGRLLAEVDLKTTTVIFIGDNGVPPPVKDTNGGLRDGKGSVYEGGVRVPVVVTGAGVTRRGRDSHLWEAADLFATIQELSGISLPHVNDSYSFKPLLTDETATSGRTHSFSETSTGTSNRRYAIKDTRFKLLNNLGTYELYDLVTDPKETTNLYGNPAYAAVQANLLAEIATLAANAKPGYFF